MLIMFSARPFLRSLAYRSALVPLALIGLWSCMPAQGKTLVVGTDQELKLPSAAASVARAGDTIVIEAGEYFDCAVWRADHLTIEGKGGGAVITDKTCEGKGLFITRGNDITIRNLTFTRARVPDGNGAGIRAEGVNLRIEHSRFINNENGILANPSPTSTITILDSEFTRNGKCEPNCAHGIYINEVALLHVEGSKFMETKTGHHIKSRALRTELIGNEIVDGEAGTSSYLVDIPNGGSLVMTDNVMEKGPHSSNPGIAIMIGAEGNSARTGELRFSGNTLTNHTDVATVFVKNWTSADVVLDRNTLNGPITPVSQDGYLLHRVRGWLGETIAISKRLIKIALFR
jgi:hypothetical protein